MNKDNNDKIRDLHIILIIVSVEYWLCITNEKINKNLVKDLVKLILMKKL